jgi:hypothetical protein
MKKLLLAAMMALGLGLSIAPAFAATAPNHLPQQIHHGMDFGSDSGTAA